MSGGEEFGLACHRCPRPRRIVALEREAVMRHPGLVERIVGGVASVGLAAMVAVEPALSLRTGPVLSRLAGTWAATLPNYPAVGLYKGRYRLRLGPGFTMRYIVPAEDAVPQRVSVFGNRITFMPSGVCLTS